MKGFTFRSTLCRYLCERDNNQQKENVRPSVSFFSSWNYFVDHRTRLDCSLWFGSPKSTRVQRQQVDAMIIGRRGSEPIAAIKLYGVDISYTTSAKNLGMIMNDRLTWTDHAAKISQRIFIEWRSLWPLAKATPLKTRRLLAKSRLDYILITVALCCSMALRIVDESDREIYEISSMVCLRTWTVRSYLMRFIGCSADTHLRVK